MQHLILMGTVLAAPGAATARGEVQAAAGPRHGAARPTLSTVALREDTQTLAAVTREGRAPGAPGPGLHESLIFDFRTGVESPWRSIDDGVMGGRSSSRMLVTEGVARFEGTVSLENGGGFASVRSQPADHDLSGFDGLILRIAGDGKTYGLRLRTTDRFDGISYEAPLESEPDTWLDVRVPWSAFTPVFRGRRVLDQPPLDPSRIRTFGFLIAQSQQGPFELRVEWIGAYRH